MMVIKKEEEKEEGVGVEDKKGDDDRCDDKVQCNNS